jgi:hypothetical protein
MLLIGSSTSAISVVGDLHTLGPSLTPPRTGIYTA